MAAQNNAPLPDGLDLAGYRIVKKIASGGFSIVYLAEDAEGQAVAIKEYLPSALALRAPGGLAPQVAPPHQPVFRLGMKCFFDEGRALARIDHPNVVRVVNFFKAHDTVYMVMAYESGHTLQAEIGQLAQQQDGMPAAVLAQVFGGLCAGLREVHANQLLHLDIKPANIYLREDGSALLLDFGAARQILNTDLPLLTPVLTPGYAPPELYRKGMPLGPWSDIYGVGAAMFACMSGQAPQPADARAADDLMAPRLAALDGRYPAPLVDLVRRCLALDPLARPQSVFEVQRALLAALPAQPGARAGGGWRARLTQLLRRVRAGRG